MKQKAIGCVFVVFALAGCFYVMFWAVQELKYASEKNKEKREKRNIDFIPKTAKVLTVDGPWLSFKYNGNCYQSVNISGSGPLLLNINCN